jgi:hypothetical protein
MSKKRISRIEFAQVQYAFSLNYTVDEPITVNGIFPNDDVLSLMAHCPNNEIAFVFSDRGDETPRYRLCKGTRNSVTVPAEHDDFLMWHTHPGGTRYPSDADMGLFDRNENQKSSVIYPAGSNRFKFKR